MYEITIPDDAWEPNTALGDGRARLLTKLTINGVPLHLEAWALEDEEDEDGVRHALVDDDDLDRLVEAVGADGPFRTLEIGGRDYVLVATPYC